MINSLTLEGTIRAQRVKESLDWIRPKCAAMGITRVANITGLDDVGLYCVTSIRPNSNHVSVSQGKGLTLELATISAIMESVEGYHIETPAVAELTGAYGDLAKQYPLVCPDQFAQTLFTEVDLTKYSLNWSRSINLVDEQFYFIPQILTNLNTTECHPEYAFLQVSTNGLAAGNTLEEATCHALFELIERDSLFRWQPISDSARLCTQIAIETIKDSNEWLIKKFQKANIQLKVWDISSILGIPAFHCAIFDANLIRSLGLFTGTGAHLSKEIALSRALTEAAQSRLTIVTGNRDDVFPQFYQQMQSNLSAQHYQMIENGRKHYSDCPTPEFELNFDKNIQQLVEILKKHGCDKILLVNRTNETLLIPVVQVFVPSLQFNGVRM